MQPLQTALSIGPAQRWPALSSNGLGQAGVSPTPPAPPPEATKWWLPLVQPFAEAGAHRIAHGQTPTFGFDYRQSYSGPFGTSPQYGGYPTGVSQLSSYLPLILLAVGAMVLMRR